MWEESRNEDGYVVVSTPMFSYNLPTNSRAYSLLHSIQGAFITHFFARHCAKCFKGVISFHPFTSLPDRIYRYIKEGEKQRAIAFPFSPKELLWSSWEKLEPFLLHLWGILQLQVMEMPTPIALDNMGHIIFSQQNTQRWGELRMGRIGSLIMPSLIFMSLFCHPWVLASSSRWQNDGCHSQIVFLLTARTTSVEASLEDFSLCLLSQN